MSSRISSIPVERTTSRSSKVKGSSAVEQALPVNGEPLASVLLVSPDTVTPHEIAVDDHVRELATEILADGYVRHPMISAAVGGRYVLLDGTHRLAALSSIGVRRVPLQVIAQSAVRFDTWAKIVVHRRGCAPVLETPFAWHEGSDASAAVNVFASHGQTWHTSKSATSLKARHEILTRILSSIADANEIRTSVPSQAKPNGPCSFVLGFQTWSLEEVIHLTQQERRLPSGLTRVIVSGRILNLRVPLEMLRDQHVDANTWSQFISSARRRSRVYDEPTILVD
jgi:hypothetical protein